MYDYSSMPEVVSPNSSPNNTWVMNTALFDANSSQLSLYQNGAFVGSTSSNIWNSANNPTTIGAWGIGSCSPSMGCFFNGKIDDIKIYDVALTSCDVDSLYNIPNPTTVGFSYNNIDENIKIFPNPASNILTIECPQSAVIEITDIQGQLIESINTTCSKTIIDVTSFPKGIYFIHATTQNSIATNKFIKD
jgi:hypothetical protein